LAGHSLGAHKDWQCRLDTVMPRDSAQLKQLLKVIDLRVERAHAEWLDAVRGRQEREQELSEQEHIANQWKLRLKADSSRVADILAHRFAPNSIHGFRAALSVLSRRVSMEQQELDSRELQLQLADLRMSNARQRLLSQRFRRETILKAHAKQICLERIAAELLSEQSDEDERAALSTPDRL
jgi:hypothetical protein